ncbi:MAG: hypothetical protein L0220_04050 [Acidobacteria bacterium]|nr:hypothetical protein [Acidobacteriota bacterium]
MDRRILPRTVNLRFQALIMQNAGSFDHLGMNIKGVIDKQYPCLLRWYRIRNLTGGIQMSRWFALLVFSDRAGAYNLFAYDTRSKKVTQLTRFDKYDIRFASASASGDAIVFIQDGAIHLYDLKTASHRPVEIRLSGDFPEIKPREVNVASWIRSSDVSPDRKYALLEARGEILKVDLQTGEAENLTQSPEVAERAPRWSPDGRRMAYLSDESGEYQLHIRPAAGEGSARKIAIEQKPSIYSELLWSPDSSKIALSNRGLALLYVDIDKGESHRVDIAIYADPKEDPFFQPSWSPDSRWLAYSRILPNQLRGVFVHSLDSGKNTLITDGRSDSSRPSFDRNGKYLVPVHGGLKPL